MRWLTALVLLLAATLARAQDVQPVPALTARVMDQTATLDAAQRQALEDQLAAYEAASGPQIAVLIVATTAPEEIAAYAQRVADQWKIGRRAVGDGLLIVVAKGDRKMRIEVAKALEGAVPDLAARQIIDTAMKPAFQAGDYAGGLKAAIERLQARIAGEGLPAPTRAPQGGGGADEGFGFQDLGLLFFIGVPVVGMLLTGMLGRKLGSLATAGAAGAAGWAFGGGLLMAGVAAVAALVLVGLLGIGAARRTSRATGRRGGMLIPPVIWGGGGFGGGGGGGFGGGGFSSGGGGDFGGGGASGDW
ncbi:uncharacterized protein J2X16_002230 [Pelomonas aquatica]|uniref:TPM domain-containing protein n=1 Tax=Pelomonas aquatica TaxID=431058 RepID=A0ABU1Z8D6_9BURK|nr:TPM domain-containing protein [Pelomonas aquatica]MDR7296883.1 uncharacterized protein [Pelomonas aquatica]